RSMNGKRGRFTGYGPAVSDTALAKMSQTVASWRLHRKITLSWTELIRWISPVIRGWMNYYGRYHRSALYQLLSRINYRIQRWLQAKYKRLRAFKAMQTAWGRITTQYPRALPHWPWITQAWR